jgi:DNA primase catalytic core
MKISQPTIDRINESSVESILDHYNIRMKGSSHQKIIPCISRSHEDKNPSMGVDLNTGMFNCHGCGAHGGGAIKMIQEIEGLSFPDAVHKAADILAITVIKEEENPEKVDQYAAAKFLFGRLKANNITIEDANKPEYKNLQKFLSDRKISNADAAKWGLTYAPRGFGADFPKEYAKTLTDMGMLFEKKSETDKQNFKLNGRFQFPIHDVRGNIIAFAGREIGNGNSSTAKYINTNNSNIFRKGSVLYGLDKVLGAKDKTKKIEEIQILEGYTDVISTHSAGMPTSVATMGTAFSEGHIKQLLNKTESVNFLFDADDAGINARTRSLLVAAKYVGELKFKFSTLENIDGKKYDPDQAVKEGRLDVYKTALNEAKPFHIAAADYVMGDTPISNPNDILDGPASRAQELYGLMPPGIVRELFSQAIATEFSNKLGLSVSPSILGMRLDYEVANIEMGSLKKLQENSIPTSFAPSHTQKQPQPVVEYIKPINDAPIVQEHHWPIQSIQSIQSIQHHVDYSFENEQFIPENEFNPHWDSPASSFDNERFSSPTMVKPNVPDLSNFSRDQFNKNVSIGPVGIPNDQNPVFSNSELPITVNMWVAVIKPGFISYQGNALLGQVKNIKGDDVKVQLANFEDKTYQTLNKSDLLPIGSDIGFTKCKNQTLNANTGDLIIKTAVGWVGSIEPRHLTLDMNSALNSAPKIQAKKTVDDPQHRKNSTLQKIDQGGTPFII